jgi:hypothetical protein
METTATSFDLNRAIQQWREDLAQSPAFRRENLDELESHLRDSIANLKQNALADDEAFFIATRRAGAGAALGTEFSKVNAPEVWLDRALWMLVGYQLFGFIGHLSAPVFTGTTMLGMSAITAFHSAWMPVYAGLFTACAHLLVFTVVLAACWGLLTRKHERLSACLRYLATGSSRSVKAAAASAAVILLPLAFNWFGTALWVRSFPVLLSPGQVVLGYSYGTMFASLIEAITLVLLTLFLARRRRLATN